MQVSEPSPAPTAQNSSKAPYLTHSTCWGFFVLAERKRRANPRGRDGVPAAALSPARPARFRKTLCPAASSSRRLPSASGVLQPWPPPSLQLAPGSLCPQTNCFRKPRRRRQRRSWKTTTTTRCLGLRGAGRERAVGAWALRAGRAADPRGREGPGPGLGDSGAVAASPTILTSSTTAR